MPWHDPDEHKHTELYVRAVQYVIPPLGYYGLTRNKHSSDPYNPTFRISESVVKVTECSDTFLVVLLHRMEIDGNCFCAALQRLLCCSRNKIRHGIILWVACACVCVCLALYRNASKKQNIPECAASNTARSMRDAIIPNHSSSWFIRQKRHWPTKN